MTHIHTLEQNLKNFSQSISDGLKRMVSDFDEHIASHINNIRTQIPIFADKLQQAFNNYERETIEGLAELSKIGWYPSFDMPASGLRGMIQLKSNGDIESVDACMESYFTARFDSIIDALVIAHQKRARLIKAAAIAHKSNNWPLSIPVFISQSEGIGRDIFDCSIFSKRKGKMLVDEKVKIINISDLYTEPLRNVGSFSKDTGQFMPGEINRHAVLHGIDCDYDKKINSFKALSLLNYIKEIGETITSPE